MSARGLQLVYVDGPDRVRLDLRLVEDRLTGRLERARAARTVDARVERAGPNALVLRVGGREVRAEVVRSRDRTWLAIEGRTFEVVREEPGARARAAASEEPHAVSPMTGVVAKVAVAPGAPVAAGAALFVVEAMKMEFVVKAPRAVTVGEVRKRAGEKVALGEVVVTFAEPA